MKELIHSSAAIRIAKLNNGFFTFGKWYFCYAQNWNGVQGKQLFDCNRKFFSGDSAEAKANDFSDQSRRKEWHGRALVVIRSTHQAGEIKLTVTWPALETEALKIILLSGAR